jgi:hypothetical protein
LQNIVYELKERRVVLRATEQPIDTGTAAAVSIRVASRRSTQRLFIGSGTRRSSVLPPLHDVSG